MQRCRGVAEGVDGCSGGAEVQGRSARTDEAYSMRRTATEPRSRVTTAATRQLTHAAHACDALRRIQCAKTRRTAARIAESAAACARHVESACSHARAAGLVSSRAQPRARPATAAAAAQVLQPRAMRHESMPRIAGASAARRAALACACVCHRQSGWESRAHRRSQACRAQGAGCRAQGAWHEVPGARCRVHGVLGACRAWGECLVGCAAQPVCIAAATSCRAPPRRGAWDEGGGRGLRLGFRAVRRAALGQATRQASHCRDCDLAAISRCQPRPGRFEPRPARPSVLELRALCDQPAPGGEAAARHAHRSESEQLASLEQVGTGDYGAAFRDFGPAFWRHPGLRGCCGALRRPWNAWSHQMASYPSRQAGRGEVGRHRDGAYNRSGTPHARRRVRRAAAA